MCGGMRVDVWGYAGGCVEVCWWMCGGIGWMCGEWRCWDRGWMCQGMRVVVWRYEGGCVEV